MCHITKSDKDWINGYFEGYESGVQTLHNSEKKSIDDESKEFILWATTNLNDPEFFTLISCLIQAQVTAFLGKDRNQIISKLKKKLTLGAKEHGSPTKPIPTITKELNQEFLDLIGWNMVRLWNLRKGKNANS